MRGAVTGATVGSGVLVAWAWNTAFPQTPMPAEVAAAIGAVIAPVFDIVIAVRDAVVRRLTHALAGGSQS
jgi:NhaP-type Na+/H+ or K+/H+ antiporter